MLSAAHVRRAATNVALFVLLGAVLSAAAFAQHSWRIADFDTQLHTDADGETRVAEKITLVFIGEWHGIHRVIPIDYPGPAGRNFTLFMKVTGVTDGAGNSYKYDQTTHNGYRDLKIYLPGAVDTTKTVEIDYTLRNAIRFFPDHDELYWNVTGNDWPVPIDHASATVFLPDAAAGGLRAQAFTGMYGERGREASADLRGPDVIFETSNPLSMREGLTLDVYIPKGVIRAPSALTNLIWIVESNPILFLPVFAFVVMFAMWWFEGRDPDPGMSVAPMYSPPDKMTPAEVGTLIDDSVDPRDITCTLVDLAVKGYLTIEEHDTKTLLFNNRDYTFHLLKPRAQWDGLAEHERLLLDQVFGLGNDVSLASLRNHFYTAIPPLKHDIIQALKDKGMYRLDPETANGWRIGAIIVIALPFVAAQWAGWANFFASGFMAIVAIALAVVIVFLFGRIMTAKSYLGARTRVQIAGFQEFMRRVDEQRLKTMPPDTFEKYLAYAMALSVEHHWAQAFKGLLKDPPRWYVGPQGTYFDPIYFTNNMSMMSNVAATTFVSAPRASSTGSGFGGGFGGGGGFSGGGFGGGGGSAF
jgi:uncharacterized membrane protein